ncbi:hypothetical protein [Krasilnikovia sp. MM14-A1259]|uniref:hypothetical protein n=1 Tax=Krasilnikovia sp. MM14-A1259 TaxID=3373539 RepID=UPI00399D2911
MWIGVASGLTAVAAFLTVLLLRGGADTATEDAQAVFCLSPQHRADFLRAASDLKLGDPVEREPDRVLVRRTTMALRDWRTDEKTGDDFRRACAAFTAAAKGPRAPSSAGGVSEGVTTGLALLTAAVPVALGAWLTNRLATRKEANTARQSEVEALRRAALHFAQSANAYLAARSTTADAALELRARMQECRLALIAALGPVAAADGYGDRSRALRKRLEDLDVDIVKRVGRIDPGLADDLRAAVDDLTVEAEAVADMHGRNDRSVRRLPAAAPKAQVTRSRTP